MTPGYSVWIGAVVSAILMCAAMPARATPPITHPFRMSFVRADQVRGDLIVMYALESIDYQNDNWDDYLQIIDIDTFDNSPEYSESDAILFSYAESPDLSEIPQKVYRDDLPIYINVYLNPQLEGYGRTNLNVEFSFDKGSFSIDSDIYFHRKNDKTDLIGVDEWVKATQKKSKTSHYRNEKKFDLISLEGGVEKDSVVAPEKLLGAYQCVMSFAGPVDVPQSHEEIKKNHDDLLESKSIGKGKAQSSGLLSILTLNYCIKLSYKADYDNVPDDEALHGITEWRPFDDESSQRAEGFIVEVWDRDTETADDYIGTWYLNYSDRSDEYSCVQFTWDQSATGEDNPDPYIKSNYQARGTGTSNVQVQVVDLWENTVSVDWRSAYTNNCSGTCNSSSFVFNSSATHEYNKKAMILAGAQRFAEEWGPVTNFTHSPIKFRHINVTPDNSWADDRDTASIDDGHIKMWEVASHEAGHILQMQLFEQDALTGESCPNPHSLFVANNESCATTEGWASFVTARSYWSETAMDSKPRVYTSEDDNGVEVAEPYDTNGCSASDSTNEDLEIQVIRAFWDFIDANNEYYVAPASYHDWMNTTRQTLCDIWDSFQDGTANRKDRETGETMNLFDYNQRAYDYVTDYDYDRTVLHNCVEHDTD